MSANVYDAVVVGLGAMGSAAAYHLARRGQRVLGLDAFERGHTRGSSHGESRIIRMAYFEHPDYVPLLRRAYALWADLEQLSGDTLLRPTGGLFVGRPESDVFAGSLRSAREHDLPHEVLDAPEIRKRYPALRPSDDEVGVFEERAGILAPERCIEAHLQMAARYGATLRFSEPAVRWKPGAGGVAVQSSRGTYVAARAVITAGAWLGKIVTDLALPLRPERNVMFWMQPRATPHLFAPEALPIYIWDDGHEGAYYGLPHLTWPGAKVARHHSAEWCDPDTVSRDVTSADAAPVLRFLDRRIPALRGDLVRSAVCLYTNTPDGHFVIDRHPDLPSVVFAGGFSGHGFKFASVVGEVLADLALVGSAVPEAGFLRAGRFR